jgi:carbon-monoxide dehydrogenase medium subunit
MTHHADVAASPLLRERCPLLVAAAGKIGYPAIRHRGTLGGSLAHADPVSEMPCIAVTLDAELVARGPAGDRIIAATAFFETYFTTTLAPDEILREIRFPAIGANEGWGFHESVRKTGDFATVAVGVRIAVERGAIVRAAIGIAGVADRPVRAAAAESAMTSGGPSANLDEVADLAAATVEEVSDIHASAEFRRRIVRVLVRRALADALAMAQGERA